ncbi:hypothetical protein DPMN_072777 [Dreissena polymorpha]|uniref:Uncharacterized protein n=1 Tax=Dreissena polymorpha TaxID=45954 RepID=A0A9D4BXY0_DREPO|nr:hypothetical protein DPMN_072777 [Dreissena polymorpha]
MSNKYKTINRGLSTTIVDRTIYRIQNTIIIDTTTERILSTRISTSIVLPEKHCSDDGPAYIRKIPRFRYCLIRQRNASCSDIYIQLETATEKKKNEHAQTTKTNQSLLNYHLIVSKESVLIKAVAAYDDDMATTRHHDDDKAKTPQNDDDNETERY